MGVGAGFWEHLSAVKTEENLSSLRDKRLAIDLSYWLVQQQKALKASHVRKPHLRLTFFRVINLVARVGAKPIFVVDGEPPPFKKASLEKRAKRSSYVATKLSSSESETSSQSTFKDNVEECVAMLMYLGIPVTRAEGEAESLCAELNRKGLVDACVTPDSDALLHGASCVIKYLQADPKDPLVEQYQAIDIEEKLGLHQTHLLALALLVGCDYCPEGVPGVGFQNALQLVQCYPENEILDRLRAWGKGELPAEGHMNQHGDTDEDDKQIITKYTHCSKCGHLGNKRAHLKLGCQTCAPSTNDDVMILGCNLKSNQQGDTDEDKKLIITKYTHCSKCGHLGNKRDHLKFGCQTCTPSADDDIMILGCNQKSNSFNCRCHFCVKKANQKEHKRLRAWWMKMCCKMATTPGFPDENVIELFLKPDIIAEDLESFTSRMAQQPANMEKLECFLGKTLFWDATYIRRKTLPLLSHFYLVDLAAMSSGGCTQNRGRGLINGLYHPCSIERVKIHYSEHLFVLKWDTVNDGADAEQWLGMASKSSPSLTAKISQKAPSTALKRKAAKEDLNCSAKCWSFTTNENMALVGAACPDLANVFKEAQVVKNSRLKNMRPK